MKSDHSIIQPFTGTVDANAPAYRLNGSTVEQLDSITQDNVTTYSYVTAATNLFFVQHSLTPGKDVVLGDNYSPFDLQIYGKYYENVAACELQPQKSKRMYVRGGLVDFSYDHHKVIEQSVIPVPDALQVKLAPHRTITNTFFDENGLATSAVEDTSSGAICNGSGYNDRFSSMTQGKRRLEAIEYEAEQGGHSFT